MINQVRSWFSTNRMLRLVVRPSRIQIGDFLTQDAHGPQHTELLRLIGTLVGNIDAGGSPI